MKSCHEFNPLTIQNRKWIKTQIIKEYGKHASSEKLEQALANVDKITYDPEYKSKFDGKLFTGKFKARRQAMDKVDAFFKYGDDLN